MNALSMRFNYIFRSTKGLALLAICMVAICTAFFGMISGPMEEFGIKEVVIRLSGMEIVESEREGRIIMLYHSIAMAVVAIEVYFITSMMAMKENQQSTINGIVTGGYLVSMIFGLWFAYFGHSPITHGLYLFGLSLMFLAGVLLAAALWPWKKEYYLSDRDYAVTKRGVNLERAAFFTMAVATLGSSLFGAVAGAYLGSGFETFLAEDIIREPSKTVLQKSVIGHLHIMLTLIAIAITLIVGRWQDFKGVLHKIAMPLMIVGTIVISLGAWSVVLFEWAHSIIYFGSVGVMLAALMFVIFSWDNLIRGGLREEGIVKGRAGQKIKALLRDPLRFGVGWQMVFMNFTVSGIGIFMAVKLDEIFRVWPWRDERIILTGHWHILSAIVATIILMYYADIVGLKGRARQWFGWLLIIGSDVAFAATTIFSMKRLFVDEASQQPLVNWTMLLVDIGLALVLVILAMFLIWQLYDFLRKEGRWREEITDIPGEQSSPPAVETSAEVSS